MPPTHPWLFFLRAFSNELLGRYANLNQFLDQVRREASGQSQTLVEEFSKKLDRRVNKLLSSVDMLYDLPVEDNKIDKNYLLGFFDSLKEESRHFQELHRTLRWFSEPWPEAELIQFLHRVFKEKGLEAKFHELNPSIVFHDVFNFLTYDIGSVRHSGNRLGLDAWALPKSESANPLLWTVLVHEVAHDIYEPEPDRPQSTDSARSPRVVSPKEKVYNFLKEELDSSPAFKGFNDEKEEQLRRLELWSSELYADLFSFVMLGPAYLYALMYFSIFFFLDDLRLPIKTGEAKGSREKNTEHFHPSPKDRIELLLDEMVFLNRSRLSDHIECLEIFKSLFDARCQLDNKADAFEFKDEEKLDLPLESRKRLWQTLKKLQADDLRALKKGQAGDLPAEAERVQDVANATSLYKRLRNNELACSLPVDEKRAKLKDYIGKADSQFTREEALSQLDERPARMIDIINAGWMNKAHDEFWRRPISSLQVKGDPHPDWTQTLDALSERSRQVQESIQIALIISPLLLD
jgi:hypothetical protein